ncbi:MAG: DUF3343 domain-containing protein [Oscillospiraceae bacterium]|nr:DUF3343 domain-containing protein [Oscillospiraceae bacterium]
MKFYYITFRSVTFAQRGEKVLQKSGIRCTLQRTPRWMEEQGCGYCLKLWTKDVTPAVDVLRQNGVGMRKVYSQRQDGQLEELTV